MKAIIIVLLFGYCLAEEKSKNEFECICQLSLTDGFKMDPIKVENETLKTLSNRCDKNDFEFCTNACVKKISEQRNEEKPKTGVKLNMEFGQRVCDKIGKDKKDVKLNDKIMLFVTLNCFIEKDIKLGEVESSNKMVFSKTSLTNTIFDQMQNCNDGKFNPNNTP